MSAELMRSYLDILNENAFKQEYRAYLEQQGIEVTELMLDEGWKSKLAAAGLAGAVALGAMAPGQNAPTVPGQAQTTSSSQHRYNQKDYSAQLLQKASALAQVNSEARQDLNKLYARADQVEKAAKAVDMKGQKDFRSISDYDRTMIDGLEQLLAKYNVHPGHKGDPNTMRPVLK